MNLVLKLSMFHFSDSLFKYFSGNTAIVLYLSTFDHFISFNANFKQLSELAAIYVVSVIAEATYSA